VAVLINGMVSKNWHFEQVQYYAMLLHVNLSQNTKEFFMNQGIRTVIYPVKDIAQAKTLYSKLLGVEPSMDEAYYVGFRVGDQDIGLDPNGHNQGMTGPVGYFHVSDIQKSLQSLLGAGAQIQQEVKDVGGGKLIASVKDADSNIIGLIQLP
jgi:predicted enzyme related to lactoylglutathione lyase